MTLQLDRRRLLRGAGVALALPWLESAKIPAAETRRTPPPKRFACLFMANGVHPQTWGAQGDGANMVLRPALEPLEAFKDQLLVLQGLYHRQGCVGNIHLRSTPNVLSGAHVVPSTSDLRVGTSFDQELAAHFAGQTVFPSLVLGIEPPTLGTHKGYSCIYSGHISWSTPTTPVPRENHPSALYDRLVGDPRGMRRARSVLDLVAEDARSVMPRLSSWDRQRLDDYLSSVREVEQRLARVPERPPQAGRRVQDMLPPPPAQVPPSLADHMKLMLDLMAISFATDSTRVSTLMFNNDLSRMDFGFLRPASTDLTNMHGMSHAGGSEAGKADYALMNRFHVEMYSYLLNRLKGMSEGDSNVLDNSCVMFCSNMMAGFQHDTAELPVLLAGKLGKTLRTGRVLTFNHRPEPQRRLCNLFVKLFQCWDLGRPTFGDATESLRDL